MGTISDEELVEHVCAGRRSLFDVLMQRHTERLRRVVRSVLKDDAQIDDVLQETFMRAFSSLSSFQGTSKFATWLTRIAVNEAVERKRRAVKHVDVHGLDLSDRDAGPEDVTFSKEMREILERAVESLPDTYKDVFMLRMVDGFSVAETAWVLGISEEAVRSRAFRANEQLRAELAHVDSSAAPSEIRDPPPKRREPARPRWELAPQQ